MIVTIRNSCTYIESLFEDDPARFWLNVKVLEVGVIVGSAQCVDDSTVVVGILIGGGYAKDISADTGILLDVFNVFLKKKIQMCTSHIIFSNKCGLVSINSER